MDQNKTNVPHFPAPPKNVAGNLQLYVHILGIIVHGKGVEVFTEEGKRWPHDTNLTLNALIKTLEKHKTTQEVLYLQMDNCSRENKNKWVLYFCYYLVKKKIFRKVRLQTVVHVYSKRILHLFFNAE